MKTRITCRSISLAWANGRSGICVTIKPRCWGLCRSREDGLTAFQVGPVVVEWWYPIPYTPSGRIAQ